jgi:hypothetical protein
MDFKTTERNRALHHEGGIHLIVTGTMRSHPTKNGTKRGQQNIWVRCTTGYNTFHGIRRQPRLRQTDSSIDHAPQDQTQCNKISSLL